MKIEHARKDDARAVQLAEDEVDWDYVRAAMLHAIRVAELHDFLQRPAVARGRGRRPRRAA